MGNRTDQCHLFSTGEPSKNVVDLGHSPASCCRVLKRHVGKIVAGSDNKAVPDTVASVRPATGIPVNHQVSIECMSVTTYSTRLASTSKHVAFGGKRSTLMKVATVTTSLRSESTDAFLPDDRNHHQSGSWIHPPPAEQCIQQQSTQENRGEVAAEVGLF